MKFENEKQKRNDALTTNENYLKFLGFEPLLLYQNFCFLTFAREEFKWKLLLNNLLKFSYNPEKLRDKRLKFIRTSNFPNFHSKTSLTNPKLTFLKFLFCPFPSASSPKFYSPPTTFFRQSVHCLSSKDFSSSLSCSNRCRCLWRNWKRRRRLWDARESMVIGSKRNWRLRAFSKVARFRGKLFPDRATKRLSLSTIHYSPVAALDFLSCKVSQAPTTHCSQALLSVRHQSWALELLAIDHCSRLSLRSLGEVSQSAAVACGTPSVTLSVRSPIVTNSPPA